MPRGSLFTPSRRQQGFTFVAVLAAMFLLALSAQGVMTVVSQQAQSEREAELLRIGQAYARAIAMYYESSPGSIKRWPASLEDLTDDKRFVGNRRHLRQVYPDPLTRNRDWGIVWSEDGGIAGVFSKSDSQPLRTAAIELDTVTLTAAARYSDWVFTYRPGTPGNRAER